MGEMAEFNDKFRSFSMTQLNELLEDDEKLNSIVKEMDEMLQVQQVKEVTLASNRSLAEQNLHLQPSLENQKNHLTKLYRHLQDLYDNYQLRKSTLDHNSGNSSLDIHLALLQAEGAKIEEETENMADAFLDGDVSLDCFIEDYQRRRYLAHLRRVKIDKLREHVLKGLSRLPQSSTSTNIPSLSTRPPDLPTSPSAYTNGSPSPLYTQAAPHPPHLFPGLASTGYPYMQQPYTPAVSQHPSPSVHLPPRTGFIMQ
ncbi:vacuolar protein sorting-associated protein 37B-like [Osmerus eperlanus]|uniref:vacuolar protein sorting-associated protein 37B-like n=1 Tax=Osmerus eperlanus TaxID=29151 RepID=UPI002E15F4E5